MTRHKKPFEFDPDAEAHRIIKEEPQLVPVVKAETTERLPATQAQSKNRKRSSWQRWLWPVFGVGVLGLTGLQTWLYLVSLWTSQPVVAVLFFLFLALLSAGLLGLIWRQIVNFLAMNNTDQLRQTAQRLAQSELHGNSTDLIAAVSGRLSHNQHTLSAITEFQQHPKQTLNDREVLILFERNVLAPVDRKAARVIMVSSRDIGLLTALSPLGALDGLLVLWRTTIMLKEISRLYGTELGPLASLRLLRDCFRNAAIAGLADVVSNAAVEHAGASLTAMLSARAGQGAGNALLSARLGLEAMRRARPMPYIGVEAPSLLQIRKSIFSEMKRQNQSKE